MSDYEDSYHAAIRALREKFRKRMTGHAQNAVERAVKDRRYWTSLALAYITLAWGELLLYSRNGWWFCLVLAAWFTYSAWQMGQKSREWWNRWMEARQNALDEMKATLEWKPPEEK